MTLDAKATSLLPRHSLIDVDPSAWAEVLGSYPEVADVPVVREWVALGRPLIARRRTDDDHPAHVAAGLPLPPGMGKRRLAFTLPFASIVAIRPPLELASVRQTAPPAWRATIDDLLALAESLSLEVRVFGSFAWTALTGLDYVVATSDLDLIWPLDEVLSALLRGLEAIDARAPGQLDGRRVGPLGAVNWRELSAGAREVLVKTATSVSLRSRDAFVGTP